MNHLRSSIIVAVLLACAIPALGAPRVSPHETLYSRLDGNRVMIVYGRPYSKDPKNPATIRKIWGGLVPWGKVWRAGSDEASLFVTKNTIEMGGVTIEPGAYTLFMLPDENGTSKLIINKEIGQWGLEYKEAQDLARVDMKKDALEKQIDQFTIVVDKDTTAGSTASVLKFQWENTQYSVTYTTKK